MILSFLARLLCICLATFFLIHLVLGLAAQIFAPTAIRWAERMRPTTAVRFLLGLRAFPPMTAWSAVLVIAGGYAWLEPSEPAEDVGFLFLTAAALGLLVCAIPVLRAIRSAAELRRYMQQCQRTGCETRLPGDRVPVLMIESDQTFLALAGLKNPRLVISSSVVETLSAAELGVAVRHERAHRLAQDNLKRLLLLLAPDVLPFKRSFRALEHGWARIAEWAADDRAVAGNAGRSVLLAGALVRIAREGKLTHTEALATPLLASVHELSERVDRLLCDRRAPQPRQTRIPFFAAGLVLIVAASIVTLAIHPATMRALHSIVEEFHEAAL